ncbi:MAG: hypothetical protein A2Z32_00860 [Chloroflexi bacterium RBG_16_69_14]|nr:MAG: hypothetical protein A2Z32_00860 [Chloroflexi bacterium RBG_16_69_14]
MTDPHPATSLSRPATAARPGPLDARFYDLVETRFVRLVRDNPVLGTALGLHADDDLLGDGSRDAVLAELDADRAHLAGAEAIDPAGLSPEARFERDLELHNVRRAIFDADVLRLWERRSFALDTVGDGLFLLFARDHAPLRERLGAIAGRLEAVATYLEEAETRATVPQVRRWQRIELETAAELPSFFDELVAAGSGVLPAPEQRRLERASDSAKVAVELYGSWLESTLDRGTDDWAIGREMHDAMVGLRAFDGLDSDAILELGWERLREEHAGRTAAAREIDPDADEAAVIETIKSDQPATFDEALEAYRDAMLRSRRHLVEHDLVSVPDDERIDVIATPEYLRNVVPFAAYFEPATFDRDPKGIYIVTPSVHHDPNAMREHNYASISNTSIHEAYPGHHLQLDAARRNGSLTRLLADAPEFVEGWGMYSELMMREHGFDADPRFCLVMHTDAIWRACRIILDVRMHRGELTVEEATDFLVEHTRFERPNAVAEVQWYTYRPTYPLSYLLGRTLLLGLRADEQRRLGDRFSLKGFHDTLLRNGSLPISFHRRLLAAQA